MGETKTATGSCLCGAVTVRAGSVATKFTACHCGMCRRWGGGPFFAVGCGTDVEIDGGEHVSVCDTSRWAERGFCKNCGTHLFYRLKKQQQYQMPVGLFGDSVSPELGLQVFIDKKPDSYSFEQKTKCLTEAEIFEMYAPKS